jgi:hypothetical protein
MTLTVDSSSLVKEIKKNSLTVPVIEYRGKEAV